MSKKVMTIKKKKIMTKTTNFLLQQLHYKTCNLLPHNRQPTPHSTLNLLPFNPQPTTIQPSTLFPFPAPFTPIPLPPPHSLLPALHSTISSLHCSLHYPLSLLTFPSHFSLLSTLSVYCTLHFPLPSPHSPLSSTPSSYPWKITTSLPRPEP